MCEPTFPLSMLADFSRESYAKGYAAGVAAAREAVAAEALTDNTGDPADAAYMEGINDALAAIDGLVKP